MRGPPCGTTKGPQACGHFSPGACVRGCCWPSPCRWPRRSSIAWHWPPSAVIRPPERRRRCTRPTRRSPPYTGGRPVRKNAARQDAKPPPQRANRARTPRHDHGPLAVPPASPVARGRRGSAASVRRQDHLKSPERARLTLHRKGGPNQPRLPWWRVSSASRRNGEKPDGRHAGGYRCPFRDSRMGPGPGRCCSLGSLISCSRAPSGRIG